MIILAIETSCDETAIALIEAKGGFKKPRFKILSNIVSSQVKIHAPYGGIVPNLAARAHEENLIPCLERVLTLKEGFFGQEFKEFLISRSEKKFPKNTFTTHNMIKQINYLAVTIGPGLLPALSIGVRLAKRLSRLWQKPIVGINHLEGHLFANLLIQISSKSKVKSQKSKLFFPAIGLIVSGGHTQLVLIKDYLKYKLLGETRDDAAGECFDKVARILGLGYPGGPAISKFAQKGNPKAFKLPRPMLNFGDFDFSFSGLKTAVLYLTQKLSKKRRAISNKQKFSIAASFEQAVIDVLITKTIKAAKEYKARTVLLGGGVAANQELRGQLNHKLSAISPKPNFLAPPKNFSTDNAAMIGATAYFRVLKKEVIPWKKIKADANLKLK